MRIMGCKSDVLIHPAAYAINRSVNGLGSNRVDIHADHSTLEAIPDVTPSYDPPWPRAQNAADRF